MIICIILILFKIFYVTIFRSESSYFYLYRISYIWYSAISFVITFIIGLAVSYLSRSMYDDQDAELDPDLFFPFVAKRIRRRRERQIEIGGNLSSNSLYMFDSTFQDHKKSTEQNSDI